MSTKKCRSDKDNLAGLSFQAISFYRPRILEIYINGIKSKTISPAILPTDFAKIADQIHLRKGPNLTQFRVPEGCERPHDISSKNPDSRCLSLGFQKILHSNIWTCENHSILIQSRKLIFKITFTTRIFCIDES
jgi:hypothetical protein